MGLFERYLSVWVALCIVAGAILGAWAPTSFAWIAKLEYANVNLVVAVLIWIMIYPMMVNVDFASLKDVGRKPKGLCITLVVNWLIKPFTMAALGVLFFEHLFAGLVDPQSAREYIAGMILLGVAPCTAMVFVWSQLVRGVTDIIVPWETLLLSVVLYVVIPLMIQSYGIFIIAYAWAYLWRVPFDTAAPAALIGTSNFFELAVAVAIGLFGLHSGAALATVVGVLVEVPVMLSLVAFANRTRHRFTW